ncbi:MAG: SMP-30/gluconolactonase/LRE family protein [Myxococcales bacterium]|nr:SMP-30/gluconolactonase/LRE family protein [Myxococcales bacterium]
MRFGAIAALAALPVLVLAACGEDDGAPPGGSTSSGGSSSSSSGSSSGGGSSSSSGGSSSSSGSSSGDAGGDASYPNPIAGIGAVQLVSDTHQFTEGPLWLPARSVLIFSDIPANRIFELKPPSAVSTFRNPSGNANGNALGPGDVIYSGEHGGHRVVKQAPGGALEVVLATYMGKKLNSPNDVIVKKDGNVYFTDPDYAADPADKQPKQQVFRVAPGGAVSIVDDTLLKPNGIALSPDESRLYVTSAQGDFVNVYDVAANGATSNGRKLMDTAAGPDGLAVDDAGNLYAATAAGVEVYDSAGKKIGTIAVPMRASNVAFGGAARKTLYITAQTSLYSVDVNVPGPP